MALLWILSLLLVALCLIAVLGLAYLLYLNAQFPKTTIPQPKDKSRLWGHLPALMAVAASQLFDAGFAVLNRQLGDLYCLDLPLPIPTRLIIVNDLDLVKQIIHDDPPKSDYSIKNFLGQGLVMTQGEIWKHDRRLLNPVFNKRFMRSIVLPVVVKHCETLIEQLVSIPAYNMVDLSVHFRRQTLDIIAEAGLSQDFQFQKNPNHPFLTNMMSVFEEFSKRELNPLRKHIHLWAAWEQERKLQNIDDYCKKLVLEEKQNMKVNEKNNNDGEPQSILSVLLKDSEEGSLPVSRIVDHIKTFLFAGHDTTTTLLSFAVAMISQNRHIEEKVFAEVDSVLGDNLSPTHDDIPSFKYLKMVLKETLRVFPPAATARLLAPGYKLGDHTVNFKRTHVVISPYTIHHHPHIWKDPETFDPERWTPENSKGRHPLAFLPFLAGNRNCIGQQFALMEAVVVLSMLYKQLYFRPAYGHVCKMGYRITNVPIDGLCVVVHKRQ